MRSGQADATRPADAAARRGVAEALAMGAGLVLFGATIHGSGGFRLAAFAGLSLAALCLARALAATGTVAAGLGLHRPPGRGAATAWDGLGLLAGGALAVWYRAAMVLPVLPLCLRPFAAVAVLIGTVEELVYRGALQGRLRPLGAPGAVVLTAALHTAYKWAVFAFPPDPALTVDLGLLTVSTFAGGLLLGALRERAGSVWPCLFAHAVFDLLVYGDSATVPWWVWR